MLSPPQALCAVSGCPKDILSKATDVNIYSLDFSFDFTTHGFGAHFFALTIALLSAC